MHSIVDSGVTNLIHDGCSCVYFTLESRGECGSMCPLKREQAKRANATVGYETLTHALPPL